MRLKMALKFCVLCQYFTMRFAPAIKNCYADMLFAFTLFTINAIIFAILRRITDELYWLEIFFD